MRYFEIRKVNALHDGICWDWKDSYHIAEFTTKAKSPASLKKAFVRNLNQCGILLYPDKISFKFVDDTLEIRDKKTKRPIFAAIQREYSFALFWAEIQKGGKINAEI